MTYFTQIGRFTRTGRNMGLLAMTLAVLFGQSVPAAAAEKGLAGIAIFSKARTVLAKFGNPTSIQVGRDFTMSGGAAAPPGGQPGAPSQSPGALPGFGAVVPPSAVPGISSGPALTPGALGTGPVPGTGEVTWVYEKPNGVTYEFTLSQSGTVVQIRVTGYKSAAVRTAKGISLGQNYGQVLQKYGFPEQQVTTAATPLGTGGLGTVATTAPAAAANVLNIFYVERGHVAFQLINQRVVGIIVAAVG